MAFGAFRGTAPTPAPRGESVINKFLRVLGREDIATVYLRARADQEYGKRTTIKVIKAGQIEYVKSRVKIYAK
jgi:hypothetical protein